MNLHLTFTARIQCPSLHLFSFRGKFRVTLGLISFTTVLFQNHMETYLSLQTQVTRWYILLRTILNYRDTNLNVRAKKLKSECSISSYLAWPPKPLSSRLPSLSSSTDLSLFYPFPHSIFYFLRSTSWFTMSNGVVRSPTSRQQGVTTSECTSSFRSKIS